MLTTPIYGFKKPELSDSPPDITVTNPNWDKTELELKKNADAIAENSSAIGQIVLQKSENKVTVFNVDGSITETIKNGATILRTKTTNFPSTTQIVESTVENGVTTVKTTTFNSDGTIKEEVV